MDDRDHQALGRAHARRLRRPDREGLQRIQGDQHQAGGRLFRLGGSSAVRQDHRHLRHRPHPPAPPAAAQAGRHHGDPGRPAGRAAHPQDQQRDAGGRTGRGQTRRHLQRPAGPVRALHQDGRRFHQGHAQPALRLRGRRPAIPKHFHRIEPRTETCGSPHHALIACLLDRETRNDQTLPCDRAGVDGIADRTCGNGNIRHQDILGHDGDDIVTRHPHDDRPHGWRRKQDYDRDLGACVARLQPRGSRPL